MDTAAVAIGDAYPLLGVVDCVVEGNEHKHHSQALELVRSQISQIPVQQVASRSIHLLRDVDAMVHNHGVVVNGIAETDAQSVLRPSQHQKFVLRGIVVFSNAISVN